MEPLSGRVPRSFPERSSEGREGANVQPLSDPKEIFELIVKADERLKYATPGRADARTEQARGLLRQALEAARALGNDALVRQAETRLADLGALEGGPPEETGG
jgi:hypothetical protein